MATPDTVEITYAVNDKPGTDEFISVLVSSTLAERRPVEDRDKQGACYAPKYFILQKALWCMECTLLGYYPKIGFSQHPHAWVLAEGQSLK